MPAKEAASILGIAITIAILLVFLVVAVVWWQVFLMVFVIVIYETLVSLDLGGSLHTLAEAMTVAFGGKGEGLVSLVPNPKQNKKTEAFLYKLNSPFRLLIQVNRAILYFAFFAVLMTSPLIGYFFNMPVTTEALIFLFLNNIVALEVPILSIFLVLVVISSVIDVLDIMVS